MEAFVRVFTTPTVAIAEVVCAVVVPSVQVIAGRKYGPPLAAVGIIWFVIAIFLNL